MLLFFHVCRDSKIVWVVLRVYSYPFHPYFFSAFPHLSWKVLHLFVLLSKTFPVTLFTLGEIGVFSARSSLQISFCISHIPLPCSNCDRGWKHHSQPLSNDCFQLQCTFLARRGLASHTSCKLSPRDLLGILPRLLFSDFREYRLCPALCLGLWGLV